MDHLLEWIMLGSQPNQAIALVGCKCLCATNTGKLLGRDKCTRIQLDCLLSIFRFHPADLCAPFAVDHDL